MAIDARGLEATKKAAKRGFDRLKPGPKRSSVDVREHQRDRLQRAMIELVAESGYEGVTVRKLTKLAGVSPGAFYSQFDGTDECFLTTYTTLMDRAEQQIVASRSPDCDRREQLARSLRTLVASLADDPSAARLAMVEVFGIGPAASAPMRTHEARLKAALKQSLDRRNDRVPAVTVGWITTGALHSIRRHLLSEDGTPPAEMTEELTRWAAGLVEKDPPGLGDPTRALFRAEPRRRRPVPARSDACGDERELILGALMKLAESEGYWGLSVARASKAAGVPTTRFKRSFASLEEAYLLGLRRVADALFSPIVGGDAAGENWPQELRQGIVEFTRTATIRSETVRLVLTGVLEPGLDGMTCREAMIEDIANSLRALIPTTERPGQRIAEAAVASLWEATGRRIEAADTAPDPETSARFAELFLASLTATEAKDPAVQDALRGLAQPA